MIHQTVTSSLQAVHIVTFQDPDFKKDFKNMRTLLFDALVDLIFGRMLYVFLVFSCDIGLFR